MDSEAKSIFLKTLGENLKSIRLEKGLSQNEVYFRSSMGKNAVGRIERGEVNPTITVLVELAKVLEVEVNDLLPMKL